MTQRTRHKRHQVLTALKETIESGGLPNGSLLPGENELAREFSVSRGTIRSALSDLEEQKLIRKQTGVGSLVTFDGHQIETAEGWARALSSAGVDMLTHTLRLEKIVDPELAAEMGTAAVEFIAVDRVRHVVDGRPVSLERSRIPATGTLATLPDTGLVGGSLTTTLAAADLIVASGEQWVSVIPVDAIDAEILEVPVGTPFLHSIRVSRDASGRFVEKVASLLAPDRFRMHLSFSS
ncbi:GntR family transcriptional regulator [Rhodococcoides kyotonense]|uniref:GntR family transcriptional regulator n=2 Tax=Rhodococcoides kyotonense TaxID=398843 RepID=A0A239MQX8_9NOCA|nr:GntR family transcriptional regulator [Rhodococcus kyotonensis]